MQADLERREAEDVVGALGHMKGAMMKLGQMASYLDEGMPEPMREALAGLRSDAPPMTGDLALSEIERGLGRSLHDLFDHVDPEPIAAASIGQVHRARTLDGIEVAVKVQYPGIAEAVAADLDNSETLAMLLGMVFPGLDPKELVEELRARITEELDYVNEAENVRLFADYYRGHPHIWIPDVVTTHSSGTVLTTEFVDALSKPSICRKRSAIESQRSSTVSSSAASTGSTPSTVIHIPATTSSHPTVAWRSSTSAW